MLIAKIDNPVPVHYQQAFPDTSFTAAGPNDEFLAEQGYAKVNAFKPHDRATQKLASVQPYYEAPWVFTVEVQDKTEDELAADRDQALERLQSQIVNATQQRLDAFAQTRNYDGLLSLCTYATDSNPKFKAEGQYGVEARSATWTKLAELLDEVQAGTRPIPSGFADIEPELPALQWPDETTS